MLHPVNTRYQVTGTLEKNDIQSIVLATPVDAPDDIVVINEIRWNGPITPELGLQLRKALGTLDAYEEDRAVMRIITRYYQGYPLHKYVDSFSPSPKERVNICYEFLKHLETYSKLPHWIQGLLIDERNILYWDNKVWFNEVLYLDQPIGVLMVQFSEIAHRIRSILLRVLGTDPDALRILSLFLEELGAPETQFHSLSSIFESFKKIYLYAFYLDSERPDAPVMPVILPDVPDQEPSDELEQVLISRAVEASEDDNTAIWEAFLTEAEDTDESSNTPENAEATDIVPETLLEQDSSEANHSEAVVDEETIPTVSEEEIPASTQETILEKPEVLEETTAVVETVQKSDTQLHEPIQVEPIVVSETPVFSHTEEAPETPVLNLHEKSSPIEVNLDSAAVGARDLREPVSQLSGIDGESRLLEITVEGTKITIPDHLSEDGSSSVILSIASAISAAHDKQEQEALLAKQELERAENERLEKERLEKERLNQEQQELERQEKERLIQEQQEAERQKLPVQNSAHLEQDEPDENTPTEISAPTHHPLSENPAEIDVKSPADFPPKLWAESSFWNESDSESLETPEQSDAMNPMGSVKEEKNRDLVEPLDASNENAVSPMVELVPTLGNPPGKREIILDLSEEKSVSNNDSKLGKKPLFLKLLGAILLLAVLGGVGWYLFAKLQSASDLHPSFRKSQHQGTWYLQNTSTTSNRKMIAKYQWTVRFNNQVVGVYNTEDLLPVLDKVGTYEIEFKVQDQHGQWSKPYTDAIQVSSLTPVPAEEPAEKETDPEQLNMYNYQFDAQRIAADDAVFRNGTISLRVKPGSKGALLTVNGFQFAKESYISLWVTGEKGQTIQFSFRGFNASEERFSKSINYTLQNDNQWEVIQFPVKTAGIVDNMIISIRSDKILWLDDLSIGTNP